MVAELGPDYLLFAVQVLESACPSKGYTAHVLGYTVHALLEQLAQVGLEQGCCALCCTLCRLWQKQCMFCWNGWPKGDWKRDVMHFAVHCAAHLVNTMLE